MGAGGFLAVTGSQWFGFPGAGPLACIISAFVAATGWRSRLKRQNRDNPTMTISSGGGGGGGGEDVDTEDPVVKVFECAWVGLQTVLFAFIGTDLQFDLLKSGDAIVLGLIVLALGLVVRTNTVFTVRAWK